MQLVTKQKGINAKIKNKQQAKNPHTAQEAIVLTQSILSWRAYKQLESVAGDYRSISDLFLILFS